MNFFLDPYGFIHKSVDRHPLIASPPKKFKHKSSRNFLNRTKITFSLFRELEQRSSSIGGKDMTEQIWATTAVCGPCRFKAGVGNLRPVKQNHPARCPFQIMLTVWPA